MTEPSLPLMDSFLLSPRTASYIDALIREGDKFDYSKWLQRVREEEAQSKQGLGTFISKDVVAAEIGNQTGTLDGIWPNPKLMTRAAPIPRALRQAHRAPKSKALKISLRQRLERVSDAWDDFQASRARDAVYGYLDPVFAIVEHYKVRRRTKRLLRRAAKFSGLPLENNADPFTAVIRCTCDDTVDSKTISKWARALRYVAHCKIPRIRLKKFMKEAGGVVSRPACIALSESASGVLAQHQRPQGAPAYDKHQRSRVSRTTSVSRPAAQELRGRTALRALRPLGFNALSGSALAGLPPALEGFFIASAHGWE
jgi:hypothetical protein